MCKMTRRESGAQVGDNMRHTALISVRPDGFVDGASFSGPGDDDFRADARERGLEIREVDRGYAKKVVFTFIPIDGGKVLPA
jgi:hypothetical protein